MHQICGHKGSITPPSQPLSSSSLVILGCLIFSRRRSPDLHLLPVLLISQWWKLQNNWRIAPHPKILPTQIKVNDINQSSPACSGLIVAS
ncbi:hypothetical protein U9M48_043720 [Paspalum notatum var. saurae]|uniref:Uncharacterized protein n=1 Tax=Paspalum notatum var. saurae TaxID=547442 RepID=A0AAQ3UXR4_PASNO